MAKVTGVQHIAIAVNDMASALKLYRDILGMELKSAQGLQASYEQTGLLVDMKRPRRLYNLDMGNGSVLTLAEIPDGQLSGRKSGFAVALWPGEDEEPGFLGGVDHIGMNVDSEADLVELHGALKEAGYRVSEIQRLGVNPWWKQFFFYDTDGNAMEITTWDWGDPAWEERRKMLQGDGQAMLFQDPEPVW